MSFPEYPEAVYRIGKSVVLREICSSVIGAGIIVLTMVLLKVFDIGISRHEWFFAAGAGLIVIDLLGITIWSLVNKKNTLLKVSPNRVSLIRGSIFSVQSVMPSGNITMLTRRVGPFDRVWRHERLSLRSSSTELVLPVMQSGSSGVISDILGIDLDKVRDES